MNRAENEAGNRAVDSLINYETVKYFSGEKHEAREYDKLLQVHAQPQLPIVKLCVTCRVDYFS